MTAPIEHPAPWRVVDDKIMDGNGEAIELTVATANRIVRAINSHAKLVTMGRALIPCAEISSELLALLGRPVDVAKVDQAVRLSKKFLVDAEGLQ